MRRENFSATSPGELLSISGDILAFLPTPLPPDLPVSWPLLRQAEATRGAISELAGQARLIENVELVIRALARREAVLSSRMEGTHTEIAEVLAHESVSPSAPNLDPDLDEVLNYLATITLAEQWIGDERDLGVPFIRDLHARLLQGVRGEEKSPGVFRLRNVYIGRKDDGFAGARFVPPPGEHVAMLMDNLVSTMVDPAPFGPLINAAISHYQFETIHPFEDGNGRIGRLLIPLQLMRLGVLDRPLLYLAAAFEKNDRRYRDGLLAVSETGAWLPWIEFFLEMIEAAALDARTRVTNLMTLLADYRERVRNASTSRYALPAVDVVFRRVFVSAALVTREAGGTAPTAKKVIDDLVRVGILEPSARISGTQTWLAREVLDRVYRD
ncbi:MAG: Fic family protein [Dehalococcoidia bacterium]|nr:Fic family protein [Dehalococcoidia bacterium]MCB9485660.1 Fic family protein [Thermoflexaceae bacterium]